MSDSPTPLEALKSPYYNQSKGEIEELSPLDQKFCQDVHFPQYRPAPKIQPEMDPCVWQNWIESLSAIETNLSWLLKLTHAKFWCQVINNISLQVFLDSYLKQTPRFQTSCWPDEVLAKHNAVHRLVFMTYIRMATNKESPSHFMSPDFFGEIIYENYLFDIPKIMDLCAIYGNKTNSSLLGKALSNIFKHQPNYNDDLKESVGTIMQIFHNIDKKCGTEYHPDKSSSDGDSSTRRPHRLSEGPSSGRNELLNMPLNEFEDIVMYTSDVSFTLSRFLVDVYPSACSAFYERLKYIAHFYSTSLSTLNEAVLKYPLDDLHLRSQLLAYLKVARKSIIYTIRQIINECLLTPALNASEVGDHSRANNLADEYFHILSDLLGETKFFQDFMRKLPIIDDVQSLLQASPGIDETRASFILGSLGGGKQSNNSTPRNIVVNGETSDHLLNHNRTNESAPPTDSAFNRSSESDIEVNSLISTVRDVLPHLGEGYIESCLLYYEKDCEKTIHALLEGSLPDDLRAMDNTTPRQKRQASPPPTNAETRPMNTFDQQYTRNTSSPEETDILQQRKNIFDGDQFDVYENSNIDHSRIHKGKKSKVHEPTPARTAEMRQIYDKYSIVCDEEDIVDEMGALVVEDAYCNMYDDEYDDMYDGLGVDANDIDNADDLLKRRPFVTPRVFQQNRKKDGMQSDDSGEESEEEKGPKPDHFIANPAEVRAKQEERRRQQQELKNNRRGPKKGQSQNSTNSGDKSSTLQDRKKKDANKARFANHNRKKMATKKAAKGMGPA